MSRWILVILVVAAAVAAFIVGGLACPRKVMVLVAAKPGSHTSEVSDKEPFAVMQDSIAKLLAKLGKPTPGPKPEARPVPAEPFFVPQRQMIYGASLVDGELTLSIFDSLGICIRSQNNRFYSADNCARLFSTATGIRMDKAALMQAGERVWNLYKVLNWREGFER